MIKLLVAIVEIESGESLLEVVTIDNVKPDNYDAINELLLVWLEANNYSTENYIVIDNPEHAKEIIKKI